MPIAAEVRAALDQIANSDHFRSSLRLTAFLRCVVERTLSGRCAGIKSYTIAVEALGRATDFDPQTDPIVRVEAARLRQALATYYGGDGRRDPVVIDLPRGNYVPQFRYRAVGEAGCETRPALHALFGRLAALRQELELIATDIERMWTSADRPGEAPSRRD